MASQILVLDGDTDTVNLFQEEFLKLGMISIELDEQGRITKVTFKNMMPNDVGKVVNSISEATKREAVTN